MVSKDNKDVPDGQIIQQASRGTFYGKLRFKYSGKNSEGNRFIKDTDL